MDNSKPPVIRYLNGIDYFIFCGMLLSCALIGVYYAFISKKKPNTTAEYLIGDRQMSIFPIAMSLSSSFVSSVAFLAVPAEIYLYGTQLLLWFIPTTIACFMMLYLFLPVFYNLNIISSYEYLKKRFNNSVGMLGSGLFLIKMLLYTSVAIYTPSIALAQLSGFKLEILIPIVSIVCIFYTSIGGLRAVVWTDTVQMILMIGGTLIITILGIIKVGGFQTIWERNEISGRIEFFNINPDPRIRLSFWSVNIGFFFFSLSQFSVNQAMVQRCLSLSSFEKMKITMVIFAIVICSVITINSFNGLIAYAAFYDCDPIITKTISKADQIIPYFLMKVSENIPAVLGIFISAVFSAALSTISTCLNSMAGVLLINFINPVRKKPLSDKNAAILMKVFVVILGVAVIFIAFLIDKLGGVLQTTIMFQAITNGTLLGVFILGMLFPWANATGALVGAAAGAVFVGWICIGALIGISKNQIKYPTKSLSIEGCDAETLYYFYINMNQTVPTISNDNEVFSLYAISYLYFPLIGTFTAIVVGLLVSFLTGSNDLGKMDPNLFSPVLKKIFEREKTEKVIVEQVTKF